MHKKEEVAERTEMLAHSFSLTFVGKRVTKPQNYPNQALETIHIPGNIHVPGNLSKQEQPPPRRAMLTRSSKLHKAPVPA